MYYFGLEVVLFPIMHATRNILLPKEYEGENNNRNHKRMKRGLWVYGV